MHKTGHDLWEPDMICFWLVTWSLELICSAVEISFLVRQVDCRSSIGLQVSPPIAYSFPLPDQDPYILWKFTPWIASFCNAFQLRLFLRSQQSFQNFVTKPHSITHHCHSPIRSPSAYILPQNDTPSLTPVQIIYETTSCAFVFTLFLEGFGFKPLPGVRPT